MATSPKSRKLRSEIQTAVRQLGVLSEDRTPCGKDLPVSDAHALQLLRERGPLPQSALESLLGIDKSSVSRLRDRLERTGRIEATPGRSGGRPISVLHLTEKGSRLAAELDAASGERFGRLLEKIPPDRRDGVLAALGDLNAALVAFDPPAPPPESDGEGWLSPRQVEVMRLLAEGLTGREIADRLGIGVRTVETHRLHISRKLSARAGSR